MAEKTTNVTIKVGSTSSEDKEVKKKSETTEKKEETTKKENDKKKNELEKEKEKAVKEAEKNKDKRVHPDDEAKELLNQPIKMPFEVDEPVVALEKNKLIYLYGMFTTLKNQIETLKESVADVNMELVPFEKHPNLTSLSERLVTLFDKIESYTYNIYVTETYKKNLYGYLLYRNEFLALLKDTREILSLDEELE